MAGKDYYSLLGVNRDAGEREIKQAYRRQARKYHPDVNPGEKSAEAKFKEINEAYEVLSNKEKRQKYDQFGDQWQYADQFTQGERRQAPFGDFSRAGGAQSSYFEEADLNGLFSNLFGGGARSRRVRSRRGQDIEHPVEVTLGEAYRGTKRTIAFQTEEPCSGCNGTGRTQSLPCSICHGSGVVSSLKRLEVKLPPGVKVGSRVRVPGKGRPGSAGGANGNLYLVVSVKLHHLFERRGDDL